MYEKIQEKQADPESFLGVQTESYTGEYEGGVGARGAYPGVSTLAMAFYPVGK